MALSCSLSSWSEPEIIEHQISDDGWVEVPLDFTFPFYGNSYVTSFMFSNGVVGFLNPLTVDGTGYIHDGLCCNGEDFTNGATGVRFNYTIMPWHTDLIDTGLGRFYTQGDSTYQKYMWENLAEYRYPDRENSFDLTIYPLGNIAMNYTEMAINNHSVTVAVVGDLSAGEYEQWFYNHPTDGAIYWNNQEDDPVEIANGESICSVVPDTHISCLYYPQVYADNVYNEQCNLDPLYDYGCDGWDDAYIDEYVEEDEPDVWIEEEEEELDLYIPIDIPTYIEIDTGPVEIEIDIAMFEEFELQLPEFEMEEFSQETMMAEIEAEMEEYFDPLPEPEPVEELEEPIEEQLDEPEPEEDSVPEEQEPEEQEQEEIEDEPREDEELEESTDEELEESPEETEELEEVAPEPEVVEEKIEEKKKESKKDKMREIISNKLQNLAMEMGEASSLEEQQKLQSLILALLNFNSEFSNYNSQLADSIFYESKDIYTGRQVPDSQRGLRNGLANEILHNKLVDLQWQR